MPWNSAQGLAGLSRLPLHFAAMQEIIVEKPYQFVPPLRSGWGPYFVRNFKLVDLYLKRCEGVTSHEVRHADRLRDSLADNKGILLTPNHCRYADPIAMGWAAIEADCYLYAMASWHLFNQSRFQALAMRMVGGFSVYREGVDRASLDTALEILTSAERPLVIFPEGTVFRSNDRLQPLLDGVAFLARSAARRRAKMDGGKVVIHPVAIKYVFHGDLHETIEPVLKSIEERLGWHEPQCPLAPLKRLERLGEALFSLKEIQFLGRSYPGKLAERKQRLIRSLLDPLDQAWVGEIQDLHFLPRIKQLRSRIVPRLSEPDVTSEEKQGIWKQLSDIYAAQQIESYPIGYLDQPTDTRILETVERFDEDVHDRASIHRPLHCILEIGEAIEADPSKPPKGERDPIMLQIESGLSGMLHQLSDEATPYQP